jgi:molybdenum cofactor cytidylyltransferase
MVSRDEIVATVKVIPYAAAKNAVDAVAKISGNSPIEVHAFRQMSTALIVTQLEEPKASIVEKTRNILAARLKPIGGTISSETYCPHTADSVAEKLREAQRSGAEIYFVLGASAISDRRDVIPSGLVRAGGEIIHFGMPVDPGNLLLLGKLGGRYVIGLPGCARSPKVNGLDLILRQIFAGIDVSREDIMRMGVGGLLTEMTERPQPRHGKVERAADKKTQNAAPKIAAVVLAAGLSSRMGSNKLLAEINGSTLIRKTVSAALESNVSSVVVVTGHQEAMIHKALAGLDVAYAHNPQYADGLSSSLRTGITALPDDCDGAIVMLGDMPEISVGLLNKLIGAFSPDTGCAIGIATSAGKRGNPVLWARRFFAEIEQITGDTGAKHLVGKHEDLVFEIEAGDSAFLDVDTPEALDALKARTNVGTVGS